MTVLSGDSIHDKAPTSNSKPGVEGTSLIINGWSLFCFVFTNIALAQPTYRPGCNIIGMSVVY